jgi:diguanylate cyclase (GGDEF)-like protein
LTASSATSVKDDNEPMAGARLPALESLAPTVSIVAALVLLAAIAALDYITGNETGFSFFYLMPVGLVAWVNGRWPGLGAAVVAAGVWAFIDDAAGHRYTHPLYLLWNAGTRLLVFASMALVLSALRRALQEERVLSRIDHLTGALNARSFLATVQAEIDRSRRYGRPFSLAYIDVDNFKSVNDTLGHAAGDELLRGVVLSIREQLRTTDVVSRLGGDEFAILLPETDQPAAEAAIAKIRANLDARLHGRTSPITLSIGCVTHAGTGLLADDLIKEADALMYRAKQGGKNAASFSLGSRQPDLDFGRAPKG